MTMSYDHNMPSIKHSPLLLSLSGSLEKGVVLIRLMTTEEGAVFNQSEFKVPLRVVVLQ